jgi:hypothetical protein
MDLSTLIPTLMFTTLFAAVGIGLFGTRGAKRAEDGAADHSTLGRSAETDRTTGERKPHDLSRAAEQRA